MKTASFSFIRCSKTWHFSQIKYWSNHFVCTKTIFLSGDQVTQDYWFLSIKFIFISFFAIFTKFLQKKIKKPLPCVCISRYLSLFHLSLFLSFYLSLFLCIYAERTRWSNTTKNAITRSCSEKSKLLNKMLEIRVPLTQQTSIGLFIFT